MKKFLSILLISCMLVSVAGCGKKDKAPLPEDTAQATEPVEDIAADEEAQEMPGEPSAEELIYDRAFTMSFSYEDAFSMSVEIDGTDYTTMTLSSKDYSTTAVFLGDNSYMKTIDAEGAVNAYKLPMETAKQSFHTMDQNDIDELISSMVLVKEDDAEWTYDAVMPGDETGEEDTATITVSKATRGITKISYMENGEQTDIIFAPLSARSFTEEDFADAQDIPEDEAMSIIFSAILGPMMGAASEELEDGDTIFDFTEDDTDSETDGEEEVEVFGTH